MAQTDMSYFVGLVLLACGVLVVIRAVYSGVRGFTSRSWPAVTGLVEAVRIDRGSGTEGGSLYSVRARYRYTVDDTVFIGIRVHFAEWIQLPVSWSAVRAYNQLRAVRNLNVYYNPRDPADSVLWPGIAGGIGYALVGGGSLIGIALMLLLV